MTSHVFFEYIANDFHQWNIQKRIRKPIIVFVDRNKSHMTSAINEFCDNNQIIFYALPLNTAHILQLADEGVFKSMKQDWKSAAPNCFIFNSVLSLNVLAIILNLLFENMGYTHLILKRWIYTRSVLNQQKIYRQNSQKENPLNILRKKISLAQKKL